MRRYRGLPYLNEEASSALSFLESEQDGFRRKTVEDFQTQEIDGKVTKEAEILKAIGFNPKKASLKRMVKEITYA